MTIKEAIKELTVEYLGDSEKIIEAKKIAIKALLEKESKKAALVLYRSENDLTRKEELIRNLTYTMEKHKSDNVDTFGTNISAMCKDILDYLEQEPYKESEV